MTPFIKDLKTTIKERNEELKNLICYFFGHNFDKWQPYYKKSIGCLRQCKRCSIFDHDSQMGHTGLIKEG